MSASLALTLLLLGAGHPEGIRWDQTFEDALKKARVQKKPVMIDFWAEWCGWCHRLDKTTYVDPTVALLTQAFVAVKVNTEGLPRETAVAERYDVTSLPTILFVSPAGRPISRVSGFQGPGTFPHTLEKARMDAQRIMALEAAIEKNPKDAAALTALGTHLFEQELYGDARDMLYQAVRVDADLPPADRRRSRMLLAIIQNFDRKFAEAEVLLKEALAATPPGEDEPKLLFILGRTYMKWGRPEEARKLMLQIVSAHGESPMAQKAREQLVALDSHK
jgi:thiol-disulfide isomerase/thioredoxin